MCGLVGIISKASAGLFEKDVKAFEDMLHVDQLRGEDATGLCAINNKGGATVLKEASDASWMVYNQDYKEERHKWISKGKAILGHNRKATIGRKVDENAHPFVLDDRYVFFHNGTLYNHQQLAKTEVDSEALGMVVTSCEGDVEKLGETLSKVFGAYACVWYDADKETVYFMRNKERPLNLVICEDGTIAYASEAWMAHGSLMRNGFIVKEIKTLAVDTLYSVDLTNYALPIKEEAIPKKAPAPLPTNTMDTGAPLTKREMKTLISEMRSAHTIGFFPDEVICSSTDKPYQQETYSWLVVAANPEYEGVQFKYIVKDLFPYEADELTLGRYATGVYDKHEFRNGFLEVWVKDVKISPKSLACH